MSDIERDIGFIEGAQEAMKQDIEELRADMSQVRKDLSHVVSILDGAKGSWKALIGVGTLASGLTAVLFHLSNWFSGK